MGWKTIKSKHTQFAENNAGRAHGQVPGWPGLTNAQDDDGNAAINHLLTVELDIVQNIEFRDVSANLVVVDVNGLTSVKSREAAYYADDGSLPHQRRPNAGVGGLRCCHHGAQVAPAPVTATASAPKRTPLLSYHGNLSTVLVLAAGAAVVLLMQ